MQIRRTRRGPVGVSYRTFKPHHSTTVKANTMITNPLKHAENQKALKKLIRKWLTAQETQNKAILLMSKNPGIKKSGRLAK
jgi:hypothetical protein